MPNKTKETGNGKRHGTQQSLNEVYPIALANLLLHGIDEPHIWHGNTLSGQESYGGLYKGAPLFFDYVMMNPPCGGKEGKEAQTFFDYPTSATQVLFIQHALDEAKPFREKAAEFSAQAKVLDTELREKKKAKTQTPEQSEKLEADWKAVEKQARENQAKAQEIEDAVFDLKAVNPNRVSEQDTRTPTELLDFIADKGKKADGALAGCGNWSATQK